MKTKTFFHVLLITMLVLMITAIPVAAQAGGPVVGEDGGIGSLVGQLMGLVGFGGLLALLINVLKYFGAIKDGQATTYATGLNILGLIGLYVLRIFKPDFDLSGLDAQMQSFVTVGTAVFAFVIQMASSKGIHALIKGVPVIGKSFTQDRLKRPLG